MTTARRSGVKIPAFTASSACGNTPLSSLLPALPTVVYPKAVARPPARDRSCKSINTRAIRGFESCLFFTHAPPYDCSFSGRRRSRCSDQQAGGSWPPAVSFRSSSGRTSGNTDGRHIRFILFHGQPDVDGIHGSMNGWFDSQMGRRAVERRHTGAAPEEEPGQ